VVRGAASVEAVRPAPELAEAARANGGQPADWGLGVVVAPTEGGMRLEIALAGPNGVEVQTLGSGGHPELAIRWAATSALNLLRLALTRTA